MVDLPEPDRPVNHNITGFWPFIAALMVGIWLIGSIFSVPATLWAMIPPAIAFIAWYWPGKREAAEHLALEKRP